ncbi:PadR family transcriptional regulator [soil metagenome]
MASVTSDPSDGEPVARLSMTSYVVLGLVQEREPATAYELNALADRSIGYFWEFPRSQIYAESARLVKLGLLNEERELEGRRRRILTLTDAGRRALSKWVATPDDDVGERRDSGLLRLFFSRAVTEDDVRELARHQLAAHEARLAEYEHLAAQFEPESERDPRRIVLESGLRFERSFVEFWAGLVERPPVSPPARSGRRRARSR